MNIARWVRTALVIGALSPSAALAKHHAKLSLDAARQLALAKVSGTIVHDELEKEHGRWIYSIEIRPTKATGKRIKEVNLDADTGEVVSIEDENQ